VENETESRLAFRRLLVVADAMIDCRLIREVEADGEPRKEECLAAGTVFVSYSITPNSFVDARPVGDGFVEDVPSSVVLTLTLARCVPSAEPVLRGGEDAAEVRLEMRGILVGVSFGRLETELSNDDRGSLIV